MDKLLELAKKWFSLTGLESSHFTHNVEVLLRLCLILLFTALLWGFLRTILLFIKKKLLVHLKLDSKGKSHIITILKRAIAIIALIFLFQMLPEAFAGEEKILSGSLKITVIIIVIYSIAIVNSFLKIGFDIITRKDKYRQRPVKGFLQIFQIAVYFIGTILVVAVIIGKSPLGLLTGLGAFAAVLSFIFKDTILGFVAGIQLSYNDMVKPGDWIVVNNTLANGVVIDISLITVKVQNFDNTIINVPTYSLINTPFQNWRGMDESGGRRITLNFNIDANSVKFCTPQELETFGKYVQIPENAPADKKEQITNLELYRMYLFKMILENPQINRQLTFMVRYLQPGPQGIPMQIYCFSKQKGWVIYEGIQAAILEQAVASASRFGIRLFQTMVTSPS